VNPADRDLVYIVKASEANEELRHSLRAAAENIPHRRVWVVGYKPRWLAPAVGYVPTLQRGPKHHNTWNNWTAAAGHAEISAEFVLMNDDFFAMAPMTDVPALHRGTVEEALAWYRAHRLTSHSNRMSYTLQALRRAGVDGPMYSYELHTPMVVARDYLLAGIDELRAMGLQGHSVAKRTWYGNTARVGGERARDVKVMGAKDGMPESLWPLLSTSPQGWAGLAGGTVRARFGAPCRYERVPSDRMYQPGSKGAARASR
jgi:hypothetical protein